MIPDDMTKEEFSQAVVDLAREMRALLAERPPSVQGAVLADLLAIWLVGYVTSSTAETEKLRNALLTMHIDKVRELIPVNEANFRAQGLIP